MSHTIKTGPDGKAYTEDGPVASEAQKSLEKTRRELKDMLSGNTQFHVDTIGKDKPDPPPLNTTPEDSTENYPYGQWGLFP